MTEPQFLSPDWQVAGCVRAATSLRFGGYSEGPLGGFNLGARVGDDPRALQANRALLRERLALPSEPRWLPQVHGTRVVAAHESGEVNEADAAWTDRPGIVCAVLTADCLPVLLADRSGRVVAAAHAGWRGLAAGVLEATLASLPVPPQQLCAWLGPAIGPRAFEVGEEVREAMLAVDPGAEAAFRPHGSRWLADLAGLARRRLSARGVATISDCGACTYSDPERFFSHRRENPCGRMASLVWIDPEDGPSGMT